MAATAAGLLGAVAVAAFAIAADEPTPPGDSRGQHRGEFRAACGADLQTYCASSKTRDERRACIRANKDKFSETCKAFMASHRRGKDVGKDEQSQPPKSE